MGLILDSSVVIAAERRGDNVTQMLKQIVAATSDQRAVLSSVGLTELVHGIYRAQTAQTRSRRDSFIRVSAVEGRRALQDSIDACCLSLWQANFTFRSLERRKDAALS